MEWDSLAPVEEPTHHPICSRIEREAVETRNEKAKVWQARGNPYQSKAIVPEAAGLFEALVADGVPELRHHFLNRIAPFALPEDISGLGSQVEILLLNRPFELPGELHDKVVLPILLLRNSFPILP